MFLKSRYRKTVLKYSTQVYLLCYITTLEIRTIEKSTSLFPTKYSLVSIPRRDVGNVGEATAREKRDPEVFSRAHKVHETII